MYSIETIKFVIIQKNISRVFKPPSLSQSLPPSQSLPLSQFLPSLISLSTGSIILQYTALSTRGFNGCLTDVQLKQVQSKRLYISHRDLTKLFKVELHCTYLSCLDVHISR